MKILKSILFPLAAIIVTIWLVWYEQLPVTTKEASWNDTLVEAKAGGYRLITTGQLAERYLGETSSFLLVDTRQEWEHRTGHISGSINFPMEPTWWSRWRRAGDLEGLLGPDKEQFLVFY